jgi:hypothetical protein
MNKNKQYINYHKFDIWVLKNNPNKEMYIFQL